MDFLGGGCHALKNGIHAHFCPEKRNGPASAISRKLLKQMVIMMHQKDNFRKYLQIKTSSTINLLNRSENPSTFSPIYHEICEGRASNTNCW